MARTSDYSWMSLHAGYEVVMEEDVMQWFWGAEPSTCSGWRLKGLLANKSTIMFSYRSSGRKKQKTDRKPHDYSHHISFPMMIDG
jgi:hypothetical protein